MKNKLFNAVILMCLFSGVGTLAPYVVEMYAPTSYFIDIKSIEVSDMKYGQWVQQVTFNRVVNRNVLGYHIQSLILVEEDPKFSTRILTTQSRPNGALYEVGTERVGYNIAWGERTTENGKSVADVLNEKAKVGSCYYWLWRINFQISKFRTERNYDLQQYKTNTFCIK